MCQSRSIWLAAVAATLLHMTGCGGVSALTKENVSRAETAVLQSQQAIGNSEQGSLELQRARDNLAAAKNAVADGNETAAANHARQAELDAELAVVKAQSAGARRAADEVHASIRALREEAQRSGANLQ